MKIENRQTVRLAVYVIFRDKQNRILMIRRHNTGWRDGEYTLPSGHIDAGETAIQACIHESLEEVGLNIYPEYLKLKNITQFQGLTSKDHNYINFFFECSKYDGCPVIGEPDKCDDMLWLKESELSKLPIIDSVKFSLTQAINGVQYSYWGF